METENNIRPEVMSKEKYFLFHKLKITDIKPKDNQCNAKSKVIFSAQTERK